MMLLYLVKQPNQDTKKTENYFVKNVTKQQNMSSGRKIIIVLFVTARSLLDSQNMFVTHIIKANVTTVAIR